MTSEYAEDIADGPDPDTEDGPPETGDDADEAQRLDDEAQSLIGSADQYERARGDWDLKGDD